MRTCDNHRMPRPATGKTPVRNARIADETWLRLLARAELEGRNASDVLGSLADDYGAKPTTTAYDLTFANWPEAVSWAQRREEPIEALGRALSGSATVVCGEWLTVAMWIAADRHPNDLEQQQRILAGHVLRTVMSGDYWTEKFRDARHLLDTVQAVIAQHWPLGSD